MNRCLPQKRRVALKSKFKMEEKSNTARNLFLSDKSYLIGHCIYAKTCIRKIRPIYLESIRYKVNVVTEQLYDLTILLKQTVFYQFSVAMK